MAYLQKTTGIIGIVLLVGLLFPNFVFARAERAQELRERADMLRERVLRSEERQERPRNLRVQPVEETEIDKTEREEKIQQFQEAQEQLQEQPEQLENQKAVLLRAIESLLEHAHVLGERLTLFPVIEEDLKESIAAELQADIAALEDFQTRAQQATTPEQLRQLARQLKAYREDITQTKVRKLMSLAHIEAFEYRVVNLAAARAESIAERLDEFKEVDKNVTQLEDLLGQAQEHIGQASEELGQLKQDILQSDIDIAFMAATNDTLKNAKANVKTAYDLFHQIAREAAEL
ncbi:MAG TPA: hypothetical protein VGA53_01555 [Candidatus Paceibacterota bacterium]